MTEEVNAGMGVQAPKKGMSKGCLVAIIVAVVLILFVGGIIVYTIYNGEDVIKFSVATVLASSKQMLVESDIEGVDTVHYNAIIDNFNKRLYSDSLIDVKKGADLLSKLQNVIADKKIDSAEVSDILQVLTSTYPEIAPKVPDSVIIDTMTTDSM